MLLSSPREGRTIEIVAAARRRPRPRGTPHRRQRQRPQFRLPERPGMPCVHASDQNPSCSTKMPGKIANSMVTGKIRNTSGIIMATSFFPATSISWRLVSSRES